MVAICLGVLCARVVWSSRGEWRASQGLSGDARIMALGRAARLYAPGNPYARRALDAQTEAGRAGPEIVAWR
jgi:hypothetical protein